MHVWVAVISRCVRMWHAYRPVLPGLRDAPEATPAPTPAAGASTAGDDSGMDEAATIGGSAQAPAEGVTASAEGTPAAAPAPATAHAPCSHCRQVEETLERERAEATALEARLQAAAETRVLSAESAALAPELRRQLGDTARALEDARRDAERARGDAEELRRRLSEIVAASGQHLLEYGSVAEAAQSAAQVRPRPHALIISAGVSGRCLRPHSCIDVAALSCLRHIKALRKLLGVCQPPGGLHH